MIKRFNNDGSPSHMQLERSSEREREREDESRLPKHETTLLSRTGLREKVGYLGQ